MLEDTQGEHPPCEHCGRPADDVHERLSRGRGGSIVDLANFVYLCRDFHTWVTENPTEAEALGWALKSPPRRAS